MLKEGDIIELHGEIVYRRGEMPRPAQGRFVVYKTAFDGGGTAHGPGDVYPNGHHVFCEHMDTGERVDFYQSGCFTVMHPRLRAVGTAKRSWEVEATEV